MRKWPEPGASAALARRWAPERVVAGRERPVTVDQTNHSVVVDDAVIVKWLRPPAPAPHPGIELLEHLRATGFEEMPALFGVADADGSVVATVAEYIAGAVDGWDWFVDEFTRWADGPVPADVVVASARAMGELAGRLHLALATPSAHLADPIVSVATAIERARAETLLAEARDVAAGVVDPLAGDIDLVLNSLPGGETLAIRVHGDLHVGQFLRADDRMVVTDFDGNPLVDPGSRHLPRPPAVDAVSLVQSIDHAGRVAAKRRPDVVFDDLIAEAAVATLNGYRRVAPLLLDERLVPALRVAQELHELVYAARHLPRWAYAPTATLRAMFA